MRQELPRPAATRNDLGRPLDPAVVPAVGPEVGLPGMRPEDRAVWDLALPHLRHRDNDVHTLYSYAIARELCALHPEADADVVLPGIILHDSGWSEVPIDRVMAALEPGVWSASQESFETVRLHEIAGERIAREVLTGLHVPEDRVETICTIIEGHDTRREALSLEDALLKDADRLWRVTPRATDVVMDWFGLTREQSVALNAGRVHGHLFTDAAKVMARTLTAVGWVDVSEQRLALDRERDGD
ncbi:HD domain-containing protein [Nocardioides sp. CFH 31398]|uniref:HD domain-containing protein n=1 Tax=Nocardioides sp. CFH 31398 TaxID=2919579 RepID=UPI001F0681C4|nr:HD domain-containing protein [Nocardioides sp. CFH 31398]MCH1865506.1 HD domain-containing protein [Nocardioides sp. CFH 31398]